MTQEYLGAVKLFAGNYAASAPGLLPKEPTSVIDPAPFTATTIDGVTVYDLTSRSVAGT